MRTFFLLLAASLAAYAQSAPGFDPAYIDQSADPCVDFHRYACGVWMKDNPVPGDQSRWGRFNALQERNREVLRGILEEAAKPSPTRSALDQKIGDYYSACMNEPAINARGLAAIQLDLDRIAAVKSKADLAAVVVYLNRRGISPFFNFGSSVDAKNASTMIATVDQGGLALPDRDYYLKTDDASVKIRDQYVKHIARMLELAGAKPDDASREARAILALETSLAQASIDRVSRRNPDNVYHKMAVKELISADPSFAWPKYFAATGAPQFDDLNVRVPGFFKGLNQAIASANLPDLKAYLTWNLLHASAGTLPDAFEQENFNFFRKTLRGITEMPARWKRCVDQVDSELPDALGRKFVDQTLGEEGIRRTREMVGEIEKMMAADIQSLDWMTPKTKDEAQSKLSLVLNKIGTKEHWLIYDTVRIARDDAYGNAARAGEFEMLRDLAKIGKPVDKTEWNMSQPTVNAYYSPGQNNINFPAGILQPPFWDSKMDDAVNYGAIGAVVGHELTHGFDDQGRRFDGRGNLRDWWTDEDGKAFEQRASCIANEYGSFTSVDDVKLNGRLTLGENTADNGGLRLSYRALMAKIAGQDVPKRDGFTPEQRFFLGFAQVWCENMRPEEARVRAQTDPHSPGRFRVNGTVSNMPEFQKAFACGATSPMVRNPACRVW